MIWRASRQMLLVELAAWTVFGLSTMLLAAVGFRFSWPLSVPLTGFWVGIFLAIYRLRYRRL